MLFINSVKLYSFQEKTNILSTPKGLAKSQDIEKIGNKNSTICCFLSCDSPISESKDYKILAKVFEKLMLKIENVLVVNVQSAPNVGFIHFIHEYSLKKIFIFGQESCLANFPLKMMLNKPELYETMHILLTDNLVGLTNNANTQHKQACWNAIQTFYKL